MATTLQAPSFETINLGETTSLTNDVAASAPSLAVASTQGYESGQVIYVGTLGREGCERAVIYSVSSETILTLVAGLKTAHERYEPVTAVIGDRIRIYRAVNVDGKPPADASFSPLASQSIDPDNLATYYTDSSGSSDYWYKFTYWNETTLAETSLASSEPVRGDDFGHYATVDDIRSKAGFSSAVNLKDWVVDQQRRIAESEINSKLAGIYTTPFKPVPEAINSLTIQLAAALLLVDAYGREYEKRLADVRAELQAYADRSATIIDEDGNATSTSDVISSWPDETAPRLFRIGDRY